MTKILLIEDDPVVQALIIKLLQSEGFEAIAAINGEEGLEVAYQVLPDLILCDVMMPICDGYEVLRRLNENPITACIPFIFLTAKAEQAERRQGMNLGADDYLSKPFRREELLRAITARLTKRQAVVEPYQAEMQRAVTTLEHMMYHDTVTQLPNRPWFVRQVGDTLQSELSALPLAVLVIQLLWGNTPDQDPVPLGGLLQQVTSRLQQSLGDEYPIAYLGHQCFGVLLRSLSHEQEADQTARALLRILSASYQTSGPSVEPKVHVGLAYGQADTTGPEHLLLQAEMALKRIQRKSGHHVAPYDPAQDIVWTDPAAIASQLTRACASQEFALYYQPQINLITQKIVGAEALLRWKHPTLGLLRPTSFLSIAEESNLLPFMGAWAMRHACRQAKQWQDKYRLSLRVGINLSLAELQQENFFEQTAQILREVDLNPDLLVLEVSENHLMMPNEMMQETLRRLRYVGIHIYMDDVGTGFSSFGFLKRLPLTALKIDSSLVAMITRDDGSETLTNAVIAIAQNLSLKAIAEGVETKAQADFLRQNGCHAAQGEFHSPPLNAEEFEALLIQDRL
ncbi:MULTISPECIES: EAL domain-containing protein [unclassified Leptolyngbya]|uniref:putative bifunctional diguanylate cyclase/phosphodiesterase n=1 Tax=unclassified Leptolyngbya TaxID=2650499 RepID=UPI00168654B3|nr:MULTISPECIES: EAL domain-containing protein [unclassified Leptolyngbya]MBD1911352.1 EAL domain-containing protein [Leptolyngbya sp. FACHB-8]MBD2156630.1 EAL domain-containing protein [Leptolyngbya sp. FACHB-16]